MSRGRPEVRRRRPETRGRNSGRPRGHGELRVLEGPAAGQTIAHRRAAGARPRPGRRSDDCRRRDVTPARSRHARRGRRHRGGSRFANGTFVNGQRIEAPHRLVSGDRIKVGTSILEFIAVAPQVTRAGHPSPDLTRPHDVIAQPDLTRPHDVIAQPDLTRAPRCDRATRPHAAAPDRLTGCHPRTRHPDRVRSGVSDESPRHSDPTARTAPAAGASRPW